MSTSNTEDLISVIVPSYNVEKYLSDALESVLIQTYTNWEVIIIDDGSTDKTNEIAQKYCEKDKRFKYIYQTNKGLSGARKKGIDNAKGKYIQFLDADDILLPERLKEMIIESKKINNKIILYSDYWIGLNNSINGEKTLADRKRTIGKNIGFKDMYMGWAETFVFIPACPFYKKEYFSDIDYDDSIRSVEDFDLYLNFLSKGYKLKFTDKKNVLYRDNPEGLSKNKTYIYQCLFQILYKWKNSSSLSQRVYIYRCAKTYSKIYFNYFLLKNTEIVHPVINKKSILGTCSYRVELITLTFSFFILRFFGYSFRVVKKKIKS